MNFLYNGMKQGDARLLLLYNSVLEYTIRKIQENKLGLHYHKYLVYSDVNLSEV
jgi:hypothetical protein